MWRTQHIFSCGYWFFIRLRRVHNIRDMLIADAHALLQDLLLVQFNDFQHGSKSYTFHAQLNQQSHRNLMNTKFTCCERSVKCTQFPKETPISALSFPFANWLLWIFFRFACRKCAQMAKRTKFALFGQLPFCFTLEIYARKSGDFSHIVVSPTDSVSNDKKPPECMTKRW